MKGQLGLAAHIPNSDPGASDSITGATGCTDIDECSLGTDTCSREGSASGPRIAACYGLKDQCVGGVAQSGYSATRVCTSGCGSNSQFNVKGYNNVIGSCA